jgi:hypothetical protein
MRRAVRYVAAAVIAVAGNCIAAPPQEGVTLALQGAGPYYTLHMTMAQQGQATTADLSDMQVLNGRGEALPFAWLPPRPDSAEQHSQAVPVFKLPGPASGGKAGPSRSWMLDTRQVKGSLLKLDLVLPETARGVYTLSVEASSDLQRWHGVQNAVQVLALEHQGKHLARTGIDLNGVRAGYLRLSALKHSVLPELQSARVTSVSTQVVPQPMQWSEAIAAASCGAHHCDYLLPRNVPLEQVQFQLSEANTLATVDLLGQVETSALTEHRRRHRLHNPVKALRHKSEPAASAASATTWVPLASSSVYWLVRQPEGDLRSGPLWLSGGLYPLLRVQTPGPVSQLGPTPPTLRVGAHTRSLVFLARGPTPYRLVWGNQRPEQTAMTLSQLLPTRQPSDALPQHVATPVAAAPVVAAAAPASVAASTPAAPAGNKPWLWAVLLAVLALMGFMAFTLLRKPPDDAAA